MQPDNSNEFKILNTTKEDVDTILWIFEQTINLQRQNGFKVWEDIDKIGLAKDIDEGLQYKIVTGTNILCIFSIQYNDPFIWRDRDQNDAVYLHRIVVNPAFQGQKRFQIVLNWAKQFAQQKNLRFVRMDTWADNTKIIDYYKSFGFAFIENYKTTNSPELPLQNRNLNVALLEMSIDENLGTTKR